jgi:hypothetical protein
MDFRLILIGFLLALPTFANSKTRPLTEVNTSDCIDGLSNNKTKFCKFNLTDLIESNEDYKKLNRESVLNFIREHNKHLVKLKNSQDRFVFSRDSLVFLSERNRIKPFLFLSKDEEQIILRVIIKSTYSKNGGQGLILTSNTTESIAFLKLITEEGLDHEIKNISLLKTLHGEYNKSINKDIKS